MFECDKVHDRIARERLNGVSALGEGTANAPHGVYAMCQAWHQLWFAGSNKLALMSSSYWQCLSPVPFRLKDQLRRNINPFRAPKSKRLTQIKSPTELKRQRSQLASHGNSIFIFYILFMVPVLKPKLEIYPGRATGWRRGQSAAR